MYMYMCISSSSDTETVATPVESVPTERDVTTAAAADDGPMRVDTPGVEREDESTQAQTVTKYKDVDDRNNHQIRIRRHTCRDGPEFDVVRKEKSRVQIDVLRRETVRRQWAQKAEATNLRKADRPRSFPVARVSTHSIDVLQWVGVKQITQDLTYSRTEMPEVSFGSHERAQCRMKTG